MNLRGASRPSSPALQSSSLVFAETTPYSRILTRLQCVLEADLGNGASGAYGLCLVYLIDSWSGVSYGEEKFRVGGQAGGFVAPIHSGSSLGSQGASVERPKGFG
jgi:hypothetical protein